MAIALAARSTFLNPFPSPAVATKLSELPIYPLPCSHTATRKRHRYSAYIQAPDDNMALHTSDTSRFCSATPPNTKAKLPADVPAKPRCAHNCTTAAPEAVEPSCPWSGATPQTTRPYTSLLYLDNGKKTPLLEDTLDASYRRVTLSVTTLLIPLIDDDWFWYFASLRIPPTLSRRGSMSVNLSTTDSSDDPGFAGGSLGHDHSPHPSPRGAACEWWPRSAEEDLVGIGALFD